MPSMMQRDSTYTNHGIKFIAHFTRLQEEYESIQIQGTIYHGREIYQLMPDRPCNWISSKAEKKNVIKVDKGSFIDISKEGLIIRRNDAVSNVKGFDYVYPANESISWVDDFYTRIWDDDLQNRLIILVQVMVRDERTGKLVCEGYVV